MTKKNHCIIFIPGFRGSSLHDEKGKLIWPNFIRSQFTRATLNYDLPELGFPNDNQYYPADILRTVPILTRAYTFDVYGDFAKQLSQRFSNQAKLVTFHYDWRDHLHVTATKLNTLIADLHEQGFNKIDIIGHSMGGLITSYLLRHGHDTTQHHKGAHHDKQEWALAKRINKVFLVGTPFNGSMKVLHDLNQGTKVGWNKTLFSPFSLCTIPSIYYLLPRDKKIVHANLGDAREPLETARVTGSERETDLNDTREWCLSSPETWEQFKFGIMGQESPNKELIVKRKAFLNDCLSSATEFHHAINKETHKKIDAPLKLVSIISNYDKVISHLEVHGEPQRLNWHYEVGDGSLPLTSTRIPEPFSIFEMEEHLVNSEHSQMLADKAVQEIVWRELASS